MAGLEAGRRGTCALATLVLLLGWCQSARALEAFDGRLEAHGFYEMQVRALSDAFAEELDLAQWYNVINIEMEADILPDGWGPFDLLQAYVRVEGRYDAIYLPNQWKAAGSALPMVRLYGNESQSLPKRISDARNDEFGGAIDANDETPEGGVFRVPESGPLSRQPTGWVNRLELVNEVVTLSRPAFNDPTVYDPQFDDQAAPNKVCPLNNQPFTCPDNRPTRIEVQKGEGFPGFDTLFDSEGADGEIGANPDYYLVDQELPATLPPGTTFGPNGIFTPTGPVGLPFGGARFTGVAPASNTEAQARRLESLARDFKRLARETDDPAEYLLEPVADFKWTFRKINGGSEGSTGTTLIMGPWLPKNAFDPIGKLRSRAHPLRGRETPTYLRDNFDGTVLRDSAVRFQQLDFERGVDVNPADPMAGAGGLPLGTLDPVAEQLLRLEDIFIAATADGIQLGAAGPNLGPYPNNFLGDDFGGDFSGIIPCKQPLLEIQRSVPGGSQVRVPGGQSSPAMRQIAGQDFNQDCIPFTNIAVTGGDGELPLRAVPDISSLGQIVVDELGNPVLGPDGNFLVEQPPATVAQGLYMPSAGLIRALQTQDFDNHEFNINEIDRSFNRGASQRDTYEVKEAYLDMEFLDSRLWIRAGIQNIVWGKTELFRTTDQFNPLDFGLANLPGLEEQRIALLSARAVWSFYDLGPFEDFRVELAANFDRWKPSDLGACGEPFVFDLICIVTTGLAAHGLTGIGIAGVDRPDSPLKGDPQGLEFGARIEFRWDRFSFAIADFYGYNDTPYPDPIGYDEDGLALRYERNVDPSTGRPRIAGSRGPCQNAGAIRQPGGVFFIFSTPGNLALGVPATGATTDYGNPDDPSDDYARQLGAATLAGIGIDRDCLKPGGRAGYQAQNLYDDTRGGLGSSNPVQPSAATYADGSFQASTIGQWQNSDPLVAGNGFENALENHHANQQLFAFICLGTVTLAASVNPEACAVNIFGTGRDLAENLIEIPLSEAFTSVFAGEIGNDVQGNPLGVLNIIATNSKDSTQKSLLTTGLAPMNRDDADGRVLSFSNFAHPTGGQTDADKRLASRDVNGDGIDDRLLTMDSVMTVEQKALLGCGPFFGTRCDSGQEVSLLNIFGFPEQIYGEGGGFDPLNAEGSIVVGSFPGLEGTGPAEFGGTFQPFEVDFQGLVDIDGDGEDDGIKVVEDWVTWSNDPQPGTLGNPGRRLADPNDPNNADPNPFPNETYCTRYSPGSPGPDGVRGTLDDDLVRLPGCRGALEVTINEVDTTIDVVFEENYDPSIDGCIFAADIDGYGVRPVDRNGAVDATLQAKLQRCENTSTHRDTDLASPTTVSRYRGPSRSFPGAATLYHPLAGCIDSPGNFLRGGTDQLGNLCFFRDRDFDDEFIAGNAQIFRTEMHAWSWNFLMLLVTATCNNVSGGDDLDDADCFDPARGWALDRCSMSQPQFCRNVKGFLALAGLGPNKVLAGGNPSFGRRTFIWHSGGEVSLRYARRNVFGISADFAEDVTKTNWGVEFTWIGDIPFVDFGSPDFITDSQSFNLTVSVDRPTFINFLNANRTFFMNSQWFFQYLPNYSKSFASNGPFNVLFTFAVFTGYFQDRLLPIAVSVYDFNSRSGGFLPQISYRFTENFSVSLGVSMFIGRTEKRPMALRSIGPTQNRAGPNRYNDNVENLLSLFRFRDEAFLRLRYTF